MMKVVSERGCVAIKKRELPVKMGVWAGGLGLSQLVGYRSRRERNAGCNWEPFADSFLKSDPHATLNKLGLYR